MLIHVTQEDIANGVKKDGEECPIACAIRRVLGDDDFVFCGDDEITIAESIYPTPSIAFQFMRNFDQSKNVASFSFFLENPKEEVS